VRAVVVEDSEAHVVDVDDLVLAAAEERELHAPGVFESHAGFRQGRRAVLCASAEASGQKSREGSMRWSVQQGERHTEHSSRTR
jgi:hypothetical protein